MIYQSDSLQLKLHRNLVVAVIVWMRSPGGDADLRRKLNCFFLTGNGKTLTAVNLFKKGKEKCPTFMHLLNILFFFISSLISD